MLEIAGGIILAVLALVWWEVSLGLCALLLTLGLGVALYDVVASYIDPGVFFVALGFVAFAWKVIHDRQTDRASRHTPFPRDWGRPRP